MDTNERKQLTRRVMALNQAADVLESLAEANMMEAKHGIATGVHTYLRKVAEKLWESKPNE